MSHDTSHPRPVHSPPRPLNTHGGRRPGAGAPRDNTNALRSGRYSRRYARAELLLRLLDLASPNEMARLERHAGRAGPATLLEAARGVLHGWPGLPGQIVEHLWVDIAAAQYSGRRIVPYQAQIIYLLEHHPLHAQLECAFTVLGFIVGDNPDLARDAVAWPLRLLTVALQDALAPSPPARPPGATGAPASPAP